MDTTTAAQWPPQEMLVKPMEEMPKGSGGGGERKLRAHKEQVMNCPRCNSTNTKFCYYNNYSLSQPRYFCKTCRRYWTEGGSLRNIPVGGGSRKNKRSSSSSPSLSSSKKLPDLVQNPKILDSQDLNLGFALHNHNHHHDFKAITDMIHHIPSSSPASAVEGVTSSHHMSSLELLTGLAATSRGLSSFIPPPLPTSGDHFSTTEAGAFALPEFKPSSLNFSLDGIGYGSFQGVQETNGKLLFPFEDLKMSNHVDQQNRDQNTNGDNHNSTGYWNGVIGGGGSW